MRQYENFEVCTRQALEYCCAEYDVSLSSEQKDELLQSYRCLPAFADVEESLVALKAEGHLLFAFSNGSAEAVEEVLQTNGLRQCFEDVLSCDALKTFKPNPDVYHYFMREAGQAKDTWLVSGNPFDVIGAVSAGMKSAWVKRSDRVVFDPWGIEPTLTVAALSELCEKLDINKSKGTYE
jgi:2-haloacid dehalogenase